jgi:hypothetical protein
MTFLAISMLKSLQKLMVIPKSLCWAEHFMWSADSLRIISQTDTGRATCKRLDLNDDRRDEPFVQNARRQWLVAGFHPSADDPQEQ